MGISERTVYYRLAEPSFRDYVAGLRREWFAAALGKLTHAAGDAADTLIRLASSADEKIALGASTQMFEQLIKIGAAIEWQRKFEELQARMDALQSQPPPNQIN